MPCSRSSCRWDTKPHFCLPCCSSLRSSLPKCRQDVNTLLAFRHRQSCHKASVRSSKLAAKTSHVFSAAWVHRLMIQRHLGDSSRHVLQPECLEHPKVTVGFTTSVEEASTSRRLPAVIWDGSFQKQRRVVPSTRNSFVEFNVHRRRRVHLVVCEREHDIRELVEPLPPVRHCRPSSRSCPCFQPTHILHRSVSVVEEAQAQLASISNVWNGSPPKLKVSIVTTCVHQTSDRTELAIPSPGIARKRRDARAPASCSAS